MACIQTFGERINLHPYARLLVSEGGEDGEGRFHHVAGFSKCGGKRCIIAFITECSVVDRIINHLRLSFVASKPPPPRIAY